MTLSSELSKAVKAMPWLTSSDAAAVELARSYAKTIDKAIRSGDPAEAAKVLYLGPHLLNTLRSLGGTPAERKALGVEGEARGKLAQLRTLREAG